MTNIKTLRNKADKLMQIAIKNQYPNCWVCHKPTNCGHHFFTKKSSNVLRYEMLNIIPLCRNCHCLIHNQPFLIEPKITFKMGEEWYKKLLEIKQHVIKANRDWYEGWIKYYENYKPDIDI